MMVYSGELIPRVLRDIDNGILALDLRGHIIYMNSQCAGILGQRGDLTGRSYAEVFADDLQRKENDAFHQFVLDAVYQKETTHRGTIPFTDAKDNERFIRIASSFLKSETAEEHIGVVMVITDVTETEVLRKKQHDATVVFAAVVSCVCLYLLLLGMLDFFSFDVPTKVLTQMINAMVFVGAIIIYRKTDFTREELGIKLYRPVATLGSAIVISAVIIIALVVLKLLLLRMDPDFFSAGMPFWNWKIGAYAWISYIFTCVIQEFLARSMVYGSIRKMFSGKSGMVASVVLSSLLFGAVHIAHGFLYMASAVILLGALGGLYAKQRNIWGVAIIHYVLGQTACCLGFLS